MDRLIFDDDFADVRNIICFALLITLAGHARPAGAILAKR